MLKEPPSRGLGIAVCLALNTRNMSVATGELDVVGSQGVTGMKRADLTRSIQI